VIEKCNQRRKEPKLFKPKTGNTCRDYSENMKIIEGQGKESKITITE